MPVHAEHLALCYPGPPHPKSEVQLPERVNFEHLRLSGHRKPFGQMTYPSPELHSITWSIVSRPGGEWDFCEIGTCCDQGIDDSEQLRFSED